MTALGDLTTAIPTNQVVILTPVYEDRDSFLRLLAEIARAITPKPYIVAVDDGSVHEPIEAGAIAGERLDGEVLRLRRNVGHQRAIAIGLSHIADHFPDAPLVVVMDSDGEDIPESILQLFDAVARPDLDIVVAERRYRVETMKFRSLYWGYKRIFEALVGRRITFGNFMALKPAAVRRLVSMSELWIHLPGCVLSSRLRLGACPIDRGRRYHGTSKMNFVGLALHGFKGLMVFSEDVLVRMGVACTLVAVFCLIGSVTAVGMKLLGYTTPGWSTVVLGVLLLLFLQMGALTLMMLMLTGLMRASSVSKVAYAQFIDERLIVSRQSR